MNEPRALRVRIESVQSSSDVFQGTAMGTVVGDGRVVFVRVEGERLDGLRVALAASDAPVELDVDPSSLIGIEDPDGDVTIVVKKPDTSPLVTVYVEKVRVPPGAEYGVVFAHDRHARWILFEADRDACIELGVTLERAQGLVPTKIRSSTVMSIDGLDSSVMSVESIDQEEDPGLPGSAYERFVRLG